MILQTNFLISKLKNFNFIIFSIILTIGILIYKYRQYVYRLTFDKINKTYKKKKNWEKDLEIYSVSMPRFISNVPKKHKCYLLIGGYKDIPYLWNNLEELLILDKQDFYAPRTFGTGRSFFQVSNWKDWVLTYLEAIHILEEQYNNIDIISLSAGTVIALYLSQYEYKCKINNIFLCSPFLISKSSLSFDLFFSKNIFSKILNSLYRWTLRFHPKIKNNYVGYRDTNEPFQSEFDYCEIYGDLETETTLIDFIQLRPKIINALNVVILYPNEDCVIGDINKQHQIISNIFNKKIELISIPSYAGSDNSENLPQKCGHVMFKEYPQIILDIYKNIKKHTV
jgi:hypothetical protein